MQTAKLINNPHRPKKSGVSDPQSDGFAFTTWTRGPLKTPQDGKIHHDDRYQHPNQPNHLNQHH
jgi:hypothetical protein